MDTKQPDNPDCPHCGDPLEVKTVQMHNDEEVVWDCTNLDAHVREGPGGVYLERYRWHVSTPVDELG